MPLKRGRDRESCSFCYRRKIKCDRHVRESEGFTTCSACAARKSDCVVDEEILHLPRKKFKQSKDLDSPSVDGQNTPLDQSTPPQPGHSPDVLRLAPLPRPPTSHAALLPHTPGLSLDPLSNVALAPTELDPTSGPDLAALNSTNNDQRTAYQVAHDTLSQNIYYLSEQGTSFLDYIFMGDFDGQDWTTFDADLGNLDSQAMIQTSVQQHSPFTPEDARTTGPRSSTASLPDGVDPTVFEAALHAYFDIPSVALPVLSSQAFHQDYAAGKCNASLLFAVACRGLPFINVNDKWALQQKLANEFRRSFLQEQSVPDATTLFRLRSIEALALMVNFAYDQDLEDISQRNLCRLYLTHDSMVLMTLQAGLDMTRSDADRSRNSTAATRERFTLLFWHVYALDAFRSLDQYHISRVREDGGDDHQSLPQSESKGYLDEILQAARIARLIVSELDRTNSRRKGKLQDSLEGLYSRLESWRKQRKQPISQRRPSDDDAIDHTPRKTAARVRQRVEEIAEVHSFIIQALELECYLQIEARILRLMAKLRPGLDNDYLKMKSGMEANAAVRRFLSHPAWMSFDEGEIRTNAQTSHFDQIPFILRDVCEAICIWLLRNEKEQRKSCGSEPLGAATPMNEQRTETRTTTTVYLDLVRKVRNAVASATSHHDTDPMVHRLDGMITQIYGSEIFRT